MNRNRSAGGDDDFAGVGDEPTFAARYAGTCATCGRRFAVGVQIAAVVVDEKSTYHHATCRYPATAFLEAHDAVPDAGGRPAVGTCRATTKKGRPCSNTPQKGEEYCGPHLAQRSS